MAGGGGESGKELTGFAPNEVTIRWSGDGRSVLAFQGANRKTMLITNIDVTTGKREVVKEWTAADPAGVLSYSNGGISADGKTIVYSTIGRSEIHIWSTG